MQAAARRKMDSLPCLLAKCVVTQLPMPDNNELSVVSSVLRHLEDRLACKAYCRPIFVNVVWWRRCDTIRRHDSAAASALQGMYSVS